MSNNTTDGFADGLVSGLVIGLFVSTLFLADIVIRLLTRLFMKYRHHRLFIGIAVIWAGAILGALVVATMPDSFASGIALAIAATGGCLLGAAIAEVVLDQRSEQLGSEENGAFTEQLRRWWT